MLTSVHRYFPLWKYRSNHKKKVSKRRNPFNINSDSSLFKIITNASSDSTFMPFSPSIQADPIPHQLTPSIEGASIPIHWQLVHFFSSFHQDSICITVVTSMLLYIVPYPYFTFYTIFTGKQSLGKQQIYNISFQYLAMPLNNFYEYPFSMAMATQFFKPPLCYDNTSTPFLHQCLYCSTCPLTCIS